MATLRDFLLDLAQDPALVEEAKVNPHGVIERYELSDEARDAILTKNPDRLRSLLQGRQEGFGFSVTVHVHDPTIKVTVSLVHSPVVVVGI